MEQVKQHRFIGNMDFSPIALGTMRFAEKNCTEDDLLQLFNYLYYEIGINVHHSSYEYSSYPLYCNAVKKFKKKVQ
jgi:hypothetical protein